MGGPAEKKGLFDFVRRGDSSAGRLDGVLCNMRATYDVRVATYDERRPRVSTHLDEPWMLDLLRSGRVLTR